MVLALFKCVFARPDCAYPSTIVCTHTPSHPHIPPNPTTTKTHNAGVNPFATPGSSQKDRGRYQVHITLRGDQGYPNELPTISKGACACLWVGLAGVIGLDGYPHNFGAGACECVYKRKETHKLYPHSHTGSNATGAFVLLRLYAYDRLSPNKTNIWGAVPPPTVRYKVY